MRHRRGLAQDSIRASRFARSDALRPTYDEFAILAGISVTSLHGYDIARHLERVRSNRVSTPASLSLYATLHALEFGGWITGHWATSDHGARARYYSLTPAGRRLLRHARTPSTRRHHYVGTTSALLCGLAATVPAAPDRVALPRVRSSSPFIRTLLSRGASESQRFRLLIDQINNTDGIVYVEDGRCGHEVDACLWLSVTPAGGFRFLRIVLKAVDTNDRTTTNDLIATIGHELQHAVEVLRNPHIDTSSKMLLWYMNESAIHAGGHFETAAAVRAGDQVGKELSQGPTVREPEHHQAIVIGIQ